MNAVLRVWDIKAGDWVSLHPETAVLRAGRTFLFLNDEVFLASATKSVDVEHYHGHLLLNCRTGRIIDRMSSNYNERASEFLSRGKELWYFAWVELGPKQYRCELRHSPDSETTEVLHSFEQSDIAYSCLTEGPQLVYTPFPAWKRWVAEYINEHRSWEFIRPWLNSSTSYIHDWHSNRSYEVWSGHHHWQRSHDGKYLYITHGERDNRGVQSLGGLAQVYRMPLTLYSPWWHRSLGLVIAILTLCWFRNRRKATAMPPPPPTLHSAGLPYNAGVSDSLQAG